MSTRVSMLYFGELATIIMKYVKKNKNSSNIYQNSEHFHAYGYASHG